ncbi:MAG: class A beta-lactamase-related serine hydrolase [bacterium]|nr:class A beta-lactamase-related serine hydrolase [bacterium]
MRSFIILFFLSITSVFLLDKYNKSKKANEIKKAFKNSIIDIEKTYNIKLGVYVKDLNTGVVYEYNSNEKFPAASLIKLPIMVAVMKKINNENIPITYKIKLEKRHKVGGSGILKRMPVNTYYSLDSLISLMICNSDNTATQMLTEFVGREYIRQVIEWVGMNNTTFERDIMDLDKLSLGIDNYTTALDIGGLLEQIYKRQIISKEVSNKMMEYLLNQSIDDRIASAIPFGVVANKTGLMRNAVHDAGIVFAGDSRFIICVLVSQFSSYRQAKGVIRKIAEFTYKTLSS